MTLRARASRAAVAIVAVGGLAILAAPSFVGADPVDGRSSHPHMEATPGMAHMHEQMMSGNPGMAHMHERMMSGNPGMARMHERMHEFHNETQP